MNIFELDESLRRGAVINNESLDYSRINDDDWYEIDDQGKVYKQSGPSSYRPTFGTREIKLDNGHRVVRGMTLKSILLKQSKDQGVAEGSTDTVYPNAEVIKSKNGRPVGEIYQDGNSWGCFHYRADRGYDMIDSREDAIQALKDLHQETGRGGPDYTIKGVAEGKMAELEMDLEDPEITDRQFEKMYGMTRKEAREQFSQTDMWAFPEIRDPNRPLHERGVAEAFGPLPKDNQQIRLGRHTVDIERVGLNKNYISFAWHDSKGQEHYEEVAVGDLGSYDDLIKKIKQEISYQERQYTDQGVAEADKHYSNTKNPVDFPKTWHDVDKKLGRAVDKMSQAEKVKKGLAHPDTLKKKGVAEAINPDITNPAFSHQQQIGDYLYVAQYWSKGLKISAYDGAKRIGYAELMYQTAPFDDFADPKTTPKRVWLESEWTKVDPKYQRQGIMGTMYAYAKMLGNSVKPSQFRSDDARAAWASWRQSGDAKHLTSNEGVAEGLNEMDKTQTPPGRDGDIDWTKKQIHLGPEHTMKAKDVAKHALKALDKTMKKSHTDTPKKKGVAEGDNEKIGGHHDPDDFDAMVRRLGQRAKQGPLKTVYDPEKRVYKNVPAEKDKDIDEASLATMRDYFSGNLSAQDPTKIAQMRQYFAKQGLLPDDKKHKEFRSKDEYQQWASKNKLRPAAVSETANSAKNLLIQEFQNFLDNDQPSTKHP